MVMFHIDVYQRVKSLGVFGSRISPFPPSNDHICQHAEGWEVVAEHLRGMMLCEMWSS